MGRSEGTKKSSLWGWWAEGTVTSTKTTLAHVFICPREQMPKIAPPCDVAWNLLQAVRWATPGAHVSLEDHYPSLSLTQVLKTIGTCYFWLFVLGRRINRSLLFLLDWGYKSPQKQSQHQIYKEISRSLLCFRIMNKGLWTAVVFTWSKHCLQVPEVHNLFSC